MSHNFAAVKPKALKLPKITYFVVLGICDDMKFFKNLNKQKIARQPFMNMANSVINNSKKKKNGCKRLTTMQLMIYRTLHVITFFYTDF